MSFCCSNIIDFLGGIGGASSLAIRFIVLLDISSTFGISIRDVVLLLLPLLVTVTAEPAEQIDGVVTIMVFGAFPFSKLTFTKLLLLLLLPTDDELEEEEDEEQSDEEEEIGFCSTCVCCTFDAGANGMGVFLHSFGDVCGL
jgi:hypothetical protein